MPIPWLWPYGMDAAQFDASATAPGDVARKLNDLRDAAGSDLPMFVPSVETLGALAYERRVHAGEIPTRDIAHDWYNGLVWLKFPQAKQFINLKHVSDADGSEVQSANGRSRLRDALTLFDESGALLLTTDSRLADALLSHDWSFLLEHDRDTWAVRAKVMIFGHGLLDAMHKPHKGLCAKVIPVCVPELNLDSVQLQNLVLNAVQRIVHPGNLSPLPVMGIPGWFAESDSPSYYADTNIYRAKPTHRYSSLRERLVFDWDGSTLALGKCAGQSLPEYQGEESPDSSEHGAG